MREMISFDDVLIEPKFSFVRSRKDVDTTVDFLGVPLTIPVISSNMDTITTPAMSRAMAEAGGLSCLHRFDSVSLNTKRFKESIALQLQSNHGEISTSRIKPMVSIGLGVNEFERAIALHEAGAELFCIDVAHGAQIAVVEQYNRLREQYGSNIGVVVGNFATSRSVRDFNHHSPFPLEALKVGIGNGAACTTRIKTGVGVPQLSAIRDCATTGLLVIGDGGCKHAGDVVKAIAAGATAVFAGRMLAGTDETPDFFRSKFNGNIVSNEVVNAYGDFYISGNFDRVKLYRGSASAMSYEVQGKKSEWRAAEGESYEVPKVGPVKNILMDINGGLRSALSYVGASTIEEFRNNVEFVQCSTLSNSENHAHGKHRT